MRKIAFDYGMEVFAQAARDSGFEVPPGLTPQELWGALWCYLTHQVQVWDASGLVYDDHTHTLHSWKRLQRVIGL